MDVETLHSELRRRKALIVHFSHKSNMRTGGVFPTDLQMAMTNKDKWPLSCCVVWPGHAMELPGDVGIIFHPTEARQIRSVSNADSGSTLLADGQELSGGERLTPANLESTFNVQPGEYNEWRVQDADVTGIFVTSPDTVWAKTHQVMPLDDGQLFRDIWPKPFAIDEVRAAFPGWSIFTMTASGPVKLC